MYNNIVHFDVCTILLYILDFDLNLNCVIGVIKFELKNGLILRRRV